MNSAVRVADERAFVLEMVTDRSTVPPTLTLAAEKLLETVGRDWVTASISDTVQLPPTHPGLVFETLAGGDTTAVFVTPVCAYAVVIAKRHITSDKTSVTAQ